MSIGRSRGGGGDRQDDTPKVSNVLIWILHHLQGFSFVSPLSPRTSSHFALGLPGSHLPIKNYKTKLRGLSPRANYTDRATTAYRRS
jgi:hypothetical protein